jgi:sec-independent protein translocase protein TatB
VFDLSPEKILLIGVIAVMVLGPDKLPKAARTFAQILHQVRSATGNLQTEMRDVLAEPRQAINDAVGDLGLPTNMSMPRIPTAKGLVAQVLTSPVPAASRDLGASAANVTSVEGPLSSALPDDPSLN